MTRFSFVKMHGLGNDFVLIDARRFSGFSLTADDARRIACPKRGIGCDQIALLEDSTSGNALCSARFYNADGSESPACGNATRCIALYLCEYESAEEVCVDICGGVRVLRMAGSGVTDVCIGVPRILPEEIPLAESVDTLHVPGISAPGLEDGCATNVGNPHITFFVDDVQLAPLEKHGTALEHHPMLPERANIGAAQITSRDTIQLRVFERGTGETSACGTGACAAFSAARRRGLVDDTVTIHMPGGSVTVSEQPDGALRLAGPARYVFSGAANLEALALSHE